MGLRDHHKDHARKGQKHQKAEYEPEYGGRSLIILFILFHFTKRGDFRESPLGKIQLVLSLLYHTLDQLYDLNDRNDAEAEGKRDAVLGKVEVCKSECLAKYVDLNDNSGQEQ